MTTHQHLVGVYAAAVTPLRADFSLALDDVPELLSFLARRGCHGALLFGTTGEGPSFSPAERREVLRAALAVRKAHPRFHLLAGTGTPSLEETIELTRMAFDLGLDGAVVLPPYYYRKVPDEGLYLWFSQVLRRAVPAGGALFGYHIPSISGVPLSLDLLARLLDTFPERFAGIKDSSGDPEHARNLGARFKKELLVLNGNDRLFSMALQNSAQGCITALSNLRSPDLRLVWDAHEAGDVNEPAQERLDVGREWLERYPPAPPLLKALLARLHRFRRWAVRPPLLPLSDEIEAQVLGEIREAGRSLAN
ncbi:MAG: dihydrodipicolinate synthase family protein [Chloroflexota bacterium]